MTTPRPDLLPEGATLIEWKLTPEVHADENWRQWGPGPWENEPDRIEWRSPGSSLPRMALRGPMGSWCGYVGVPEGHPLHGKKGWGTGEGEEQRDDRVDQLDVHGGLTYAEACSGNICHVPQPGESDHVWWFGFDCAHSGDLTPGLLKYGLGSSMFGEAYRDTAYIIMQCEVLAAQLDGKETER